MTEKETQDTKKDTSSNEKNITLKDTTSNPAPLGLMGFGMTTVLLNLHNAELIFMGSVIASMGIFYGGLAQIIAGIMEYKKGNTFATTAFTSYGLFWMSLVGIWMIPGFFSEGDSSHLLGNDPQTVGAYLFMWGLFTTFMFIGTMNPNSNWTLRFVFASLSILFFLLAAGHAGDEVNETIIKIAGYEGIICGLSAIYLAMAEVINEAHGKVVLPIFPASK